MGQNILSVFGDSTASGVVRVGLQALSILLLAMVAGGTFTIWRGYNPAGFSATTYTEVHQGSVQGLNTLLPMLALFSILSMVVLAVLSRDQRDVMMLYIFAIGLAVAGGVVTRFGNQPINAVVMTWTLETIPNNWTDIRDAWWNWHKIRTAVSLAALSVLVFTVFLDLSTHK